MTIEAPFSVAPGPTPMVVHMLSNTSSDKEGTAKAVRIDSEKKRIFLLRRGGEGGQSHGRRKVGKHAEKFEGINCPKTPKVLQGMN